VFAHSQGDGLLIIVGKWGWGVQEVISLMINVSVVLA